ncbi:MAG: PilT/PilU family type 4a pilus ATPase [Verrucomicrobia bacterium]|nr:PilT/PilU family type 4a pilus ATPase [Verrucomicrobiota bacterium]MDA1086529.1 PilT/PilU family type 4a pilus ATPase [Verrucomicrobiota bacterium]
MSIIHDLLASAVESGASDVHLKFGKGPILRISGALVASRFDALSAEDLTEIVDDIMPPHLTEPYASFHEADFSHEEEGVGRFRVNVFKAQQIPALAMRHVKTNIATCEELNLPPQIAELSKIKRGIVLLAGTTGSGKSTTLAALVNEINRTQDRRIITVEDPIEYLFQDERATITQREVGLDTVSYERSLRYLLRQDPDVIMIGEMRDEVSIMIAMLASETGHLIFSSVHANTASQAIPRILDVFPSHERDKTRLAMSENLRAVVCQRLVPSIQGGVVPAVEILINSPTVRKLLVRNQLDILAQAVEKGKEDGMQSFNQSCYDLITAGKITEADGMAASSNPEALRMNLQGIFLDESSGILQT